MGPGIADAIQLPLVLLGGLLGSSHCVGMCGGFAVAVGCGTTSLRENLLRQCVWSSGRIFTYTFGGAVCAFLGSRMASAISVVAVQGGLAVAAGLLLIIQGVLAAGLIKRRPKLARCSIAEFAWLLPVGRLLTPDSAEAPRAQRTIDTFLAGVTTGFLPCGLVYAYLALATASGSLWRGMATMFVFGLGTVPVLVVTGAGVSLMSIRGRARLFRVAAWCVLATGVLTIGRGVAAIESQAESSADVRPACPLCPDDTGPSAGVREP